MLPKVGTYGIPFDRISCEGLVKGPLVCYFHLRVSCVSGKDDVDEDLCLGRGDGVGAEIGWVNLPCGH